MRKILITLLIICSSFIVYGQALPTFQLGVKGGANLSKFSIDNTFDSENSAGYFVGLWTRIGGGGIHLQPELYLSGKQSTMVNANGEDNKVSFTSLDLPILIGTKFGAAGFGVRLNTGPVVTFNLENEQKFTQAASSSFNGDFKDNNFAWQFGVGVDIGKLSADLRYESGLTKVNSEKYPGTKLNLYTLGIGFRIF